MTFADGEPDTCGSLYVVANLDPRTGSTEFRLHDEFRRGDDVEAGGGPAAGKNRFMVKTSFWMPLG